VESEGKFLRRWVCKIVMLVFPLLQVFVSGLEGYPFVKFVNFSGCTVLDGFSTTGPAAFVVRAWICKFCTKKGRQTKSSYQTVIIIYQRLIRSDKPARWNQNVFEESTFLFCSPFCSSFLPDND